MTLRQPARRSAISHELRSAHAAHHRRPVPGCPLCLRPTPFRGLDLMWVSRRPI